jgi:hypothetical protein
MTPEIKARIDAMSYASMLEKWRHAPVGDELYYFKAVMLEKRKQEPNPVAVSKMIGWER